MINLSYPLSVPDDPLPHTVAAIGFFDGIHKGHQEVINQAVKKAKENKMESAVITFHPHPLVILRQSKRAEEYITPLEEKKRLLSDLNVDRMYVIEFNKGLSLLTPEQFIDIYIKQLNIKHLIAGFDFTFGHKGAGNMGNIHRFAKDDFTFDMIDKVECHDKEISSTKVKRLLGEGNIKRVNKLLGRKLSVKGIVGDGDKRGRTIGFPTANLFVTPDYLLPKDGAYAVEVYYDSKKYIGMANLGSVPTFNDDKSKRSLEVHILDFDKMIYGETITLKWGEFIRDEQKFSSIDHLIEQLNKDKQFVEQFFKTKIK